LSPHARNASSPTAATCFESQHRRKNGEVWSVEVSANFWPEQGRLFVFIRDITQRKLAEAQLQQAAEVFENTQDGMMVTDLNDVIVRVNRAFTELTGYTEDEALGRKPSMLTSPHQDRSAFAAMRKDLAQKGRWKGEITNRRKSGEDFPQWMTISSVHDANWQSQSPGVHVYRHFSVERGTGQGAQPGVF
jgi:PAS domain S-box-containing protein